MPSRNIYFILLFISTGFIGCSPDKDNVTGSSDEIVYDYSLTDINSSSETYLETINPVYFQDEITVHFFGHQN